MGSCSTVTVEEACNSRLPQFQKELSQTAQEVAAVTPLHSSRAIASVASTAPDPSTLGTVMKLTPDQKDQWQGWAEKHIIETEQYMDFARSRYDLRGALQPLSSLANELADFDVYVQRGQVYRMLGSLHRASQDADNAVQQACASTAVTASTSNH